jgi:hypothetical protein
MHVDIVVALIKRSKVTYENRICEKETVQRKWCVIDAQNQVLGPCCGNSAEVAWQT